MARKESPNLVNPSRVYSGREASCADCGDIGWVGRGYFDPGHPDFGKMDPCHCRQKSRADLYRASLGELRQYTFASWRVGANPIADAAYHAIFAWVEAKAEPWLCIVGPYGSGKTHLALAAAQTFVKAGIYPVRWNTEEMLDLMRSKMGAGDSAEVTLNDLQHGLSVAPVLILDEFGREHATDWTTTILERMLGERHHQRRQTLLLSNDLRTVTPMLMSRLEDATVCRIVSIDGALDMRKQTKERL